MTEATYEALYDGAFLLQGTVGGRPLHLSLLVGRERVALIDTGTVGDFAQIIRPALDDLGIDCDRVTHVITTHCDLDHQGGNSAVMDACPSAKLFCGEADKELVESPEALIDRRYGAFQHDHGIGYDDSTLRWIRAQMGEQRPVDGVFTGGERIRLDHERELEIVHLPGHSRGHIGVADLNHRALFGADAIHGDGYLDLQGIPALCPTYLHVRPYLETIQRIEKMPLSLYVGCHWPVKHGPEIGAFCSTSRRFVARAEQLILEYIRNSNRGVSLRELCEQLSPWLGDWPQATSTELCYAVAGHLKDLCERGLIAENSATLPFTYSA